MSYLSDRDVHDELARRLRRTPDPDVWDLLVEDRYPAEVRGGEEGAMDTLVARYRRYEKLRGTRGDKSGPIQRTTPPDAGLKMLAEIQALEASRHPYVQTFRENVLHGRLLLEREVGDWLEQQSRNARFFGEDKWCREAYLAGDLAKLRRGSLFGLLKWSDFSEPWGQPLPFDCSAALRLHVAYAKGETETWYGDFASYRLHPERVTEADRALDFLRWLCRFLVDDNAWTNRPPPDYNPWTNRPPHGDVVSFVLTGRTPSHSLLQCFRMPNLLYPDASPIFLRVSPYASPREVMQFYSAFRQEALGQGKRHRPLSPEKAAMAVFAVRQNDGKTWDEARQGWNQEHPEQSYDHVWAFSRDCRAAYQRLTGEKLLWRRLDGTEGTT